MVLEASISLRTRRFLSGAVAGALLLATTACGSSTQTSKTADNRAFAAVGKPSGGTGTGGPRVAPSASATDVRGNSWLLLIAINKYKNPSEKLRNLKGPRKDVRVLKDQLFRGYGFYADRTIELYDEGATRRAITKSLRDLSENTKDDDRVLIYYSGHGFTDPGSGTGYWIPHDGGDDEDAKNNWLPNAEIRGFLGKLKARNVLLIADSCFSGDLLNESRSVGRDDSSALKRVLKLKSRQVMTSGSSEPVPDTSFNGHSAFAYHLIESLRRNEDRFVHPLTLFTSVLKNTKKTTPLFGQLKDSGHQAGGSYLFLFAPEMVEITGGNFLMGCRSDEGGPTCDADEGPQKEVSLPTFWFDRTEVTVDAYKKCVAAGGCSANGLKMPVIGGKTRDSLAWACNWEQKNRDDHPINCIDWAQANAYCKWAGKRLPTEAEWEKASRGIAGAQFPWGNDAFGAVAIANILDKTAQSRWPNWKVHEDFSDGFIATSPVAKFPEGATAGGAMDLVGNVSEWVSDWYVKDRYRSARGASWMSLPSVARTSYRMRFAPSDRLATMGFRCVRDPQTK